MFYDLFYTMMNSYGIEQRDIENLLRETKHITDEQIFVISRFLNETRSVNIFFTRWIGDTSISLKTFDIAVLYEFKNRAGNKLASLDLNFNKETLYANYEDTTLEIHNDILDYDNSKKNQLNDLRMEAMGELLYRYYIKLLYSLYRELRRHHY